MHFYYLFRSKSPKNNEHPSEQPTSRPTLTPPPPSSHAQMIVFVTVCFVAVMLYVLKEYYFRKVEEKSSADNVEMSNVSGHVDTNTAYGSTYHKVNGNDHA